MATVLPLLSGTRPLHVAEAGLARLDAVRPEPKAETEGILNPLTLPPEERPRWSSAQGPGADGCEGPGC